MPLFVLSTPYITHIMASTTQVVQEQATHWHAHASQHTHTHRDSKKASFCSQHSIYNTYHGINITGGLRTSYTLVCMWFLLASFLISVHCNTWLAYFSAATVGLVTMYVGIVSLAPSCTRPGGFLGFLKYRKLAGVSHFGTIDTTLFGRCVDARVYCVILFVCVRVWMCVHAYVR
jgi:hypothetical protein